MTAHTPIFTSARAAIPPIIVADVTNWTYLTVCVCLAQWISHLPLEETSGGTPAIVGAGSAFVTPASVSTPPASSANRINGWGGIPPAVVGNVATRRFSSAEHTLPQHPSSAFGSVSRSSQPPRRGPRASFPLESTSAGGMSASGPASNRSGSGVFSGNVQLLVAMYPLVEPGRYEIAGHPTHSLAVQNEDVLDYLTRFDSHGLLLTLNIPRQGLVAPEAFTSQILSSLALKGLSLPSPPQPLAPIRHFPSAEQEGPQPLAGSWHAVAIDLHMIDQRPAKSFCIHASAFECYMIFHAPVAGHDLTPSAILTVCPDVDDARPVTPSPPTPTPAVSLIRPRPSPPSIDRRVRQRQDELQSRQQTPLPAISPLAQQTPSIHPNTAAVFPRPVTPPCLLLPPQFTILTRTDVGPLKPGPNLARAHDIYVWQLTLSHEANLFVNFDMHARSIESGVNGLWLFLLHFEQRCTIDEPFILPDGILECLAMENKAVSSAINEPFALASVNTTMVPTVKFPLALGLRELSIARPLPLQSRIGDSGPQPDLEASSFQFFRLLILLSGRDVRYFPPMAHCSHCIATPLGQGPIPVSIWLLVALTAGREGMLIPPEVLLALDPEAFDILAPWMTLKVSDPLPTNLMHPLVQFLMTVMETQPGDIGNNRTEDFHNACTIMFMCKVLLGSTSFWDHPEFLALKRGFDITIKGTSVVRRMTASCSALSML
ncbi:hypothetical protein B0H14DRAFT_3125902, partial [Mycena olivaceomarginata]